MMILDLAQTAACLRASPAQGDRGLMPGDDPLPGGGEEFADTLQEDADKTGARDENAQRPPDPPLGPPLAALLAPGALPAADSADADGPEGGMPLAQPPSAEGAPVGMPEPAAPGSAAFGSAAPGSGTSIASGPADPDPASHADAPAGGAGAPSPLSDPALSSDQEGPADPVLPPVMVGASGPRPPDGEATADPAAISGTPTGRAAAAPPATPVVSGAEAIMRAMLSPTGAQARADLTANKATARPEEGATEGGTSDTADQMPPPPTTTLTRTDAAEARTGPSFAKDAFPPSPGPVVADPPPPQDETGGGPPAQEAQTREDQTREDQTRPDFGKSLHSPSHDWPITAAMTEGGGPADETLVRNLVVQAEQTLRSITAGDPAPAGRAQPAAPTQGAAPMLPTSVTVNPTGIEVQLPVDDMGTLRMEFVQSGDRLHVAVAAERPELLDLLRRHADLLATELRQSGFAATDISFGAWAGAGGHQTPAPDQSGRIGVAEEDPGQTAATVSAEIARPLPETAGHLNLRM